MSERLVCPVPEKELLVVESMGRYRQKTSQELVNDPSRALEVMKDAEPAVQAYYAPVFAHNEDLGNYRVARTMRSIAMSAAFFRGGTFVMNWMGPELTTYNQDKSEKAPFALSNYFAPLPELQVFDFETPECNQFVREVGGVMWDIFEVGVLDPDQQAIPLVTELKNWHQRFVDAERITEKGETPEDIEGFLLNLAEDNAHAVLHTLIGLGGLLQFHNDGNNTPPDVFAGVAISEQRRLAGIASVNRTFAQKNIRPEKTTDYRAAAVVAFEQALVTGQPMPRSSTANYFVFNDEYQIVSPHKSLASGAWQEPAMCPAVHRYYAHIDPQRGNETFFRAMDTAFDVERPWSHRPNEIGAIRGRASTGELSINLGVLTAMHTIYPSFPLVA